MCGAFGCIAAGADLLVAFLALRTGKGAVLLDHCLLYTSAPEEKALLVLTPSDFPAINRCLEAYSAKTF